MKNTIKVFSCFAASLVMATAVYAENVELYALDGRTLLIDESQVELYTAEGMGWLKEKPVTMYSLDGRTIVVPVDRVEAQKGVGWYLEEEINLLGDNDAQTPDDNTSPENNAEPETPASVAIKYTDGTIVTVPADHLAIYKMLGWIEATYEESEKTTVLMYDANGVAKEVSINDVGRYELEGWATVKPDGSNMTVYSYDGNQQQIPDSQYDIYKTQGWYATYDEAVYTYAIYGNGTDVEGAEMLLSDKKYELAYNKVRDALDKIESSGSDYVTKLYDMRSKIMNAWREAANSPLGFINYWFAKKDESDIIVFEYRNVSNSRIKSFRINFDICDADGNVIEKNSGSYFVENLQMVPCDKKRVAWIIEKGDKAKSIKNLKVKEVVFADGTKWSAEN